MIFRYLQLRSAGVPVSFPGTLRLWIMRALEPPLVQALVLAATQKINWEPKLLVAHFLAGGHPSAVVAAAIALRDAGVTPSVPLLTAVDLAGQDVVMQVQRFIRLRQAGNTTELGPFLSTGLETH